jgi:hypothetical protein
MLGIGTLILSGAVMDCSDLDGYDSVTPADSTGWALNCENVNQQSQASYSLLLVILIIVSAVIILVVLRALG